MKKAIFVICSVFLSINAWAVVPDYVKDSFGTKIADSASKGGAEYIMCGPGAAYCDVYLKDGTDTTADATQMTDYVIVDPKADHDSDDDNFLYYHGEIQSLNPKNYSANDKPVQPAPAVVAQSATVPYDMQVRGNGMQITSTADDLIIDRIDINRGACTSLDFKEVRDKSNAKAKIDPSSKDTWGYHKYHNAGVFKFGEIQRWETAEGCNIIEVQVTTNHGMWTSSFR